MSLVISLVAVIATIVAFVPTYLTGIGALRSTMDDLRLSYVNRTREGLNSFFETPYTAMAEVQGLISKGMVDLSNDTILLHHATDASLRYPDTVNVVIWNFWNNGQFRYVSCDNRFYNIYNSAIFVGANNTHIVVQILNSRTYQLGRISRLEPLPPGYQIEAHRAAIAHPEPVRWSGSFIGYSSVQNSAYARIVDPATQQPIGVFSFEVVSGNVGAFLRRLGLRSRARAAVVDCLTGYVLGNSWGELNELLSPNFLDIFAPPHSRMLLKVLTNMSDPLLLETVTTLGVNNILSGPVPFQDTVKTARGATYLNIEEVQAPGLRVRLLLVMPEIDFLEDIYRAQTITIVVVVLLVVVMMVLAVVLAHLMTAPLNRLGHRMALTASLQDEGEDDPDSAFSEVASMQAAYKAMKRELNRMKSYLPQSVLYPNGDDEEEDDEEEKARTPQESSISGSKTVSEVSRTVTGSERTPPADTLSVRSSRSHRSSHRGGAGGATAGLNTRGEITLKRVSVVVFNMVDFHNASRSSASSVLKLQQSFLNIIHKVVKENKGVVDVFQGDHVVCSFNAVGHTAAHGKRAAMVALTVLREAAKDSRLPHVTCGMSSGLAHVGNMGTEEMRRFCIVGPVVPQAMLLERMTKLYPDTSVLFPAVMISEIELEMFYQTIDITWIPGVAVPQRICTLVGLRGSAEHHEWMYQLEQGATTDPFANLNRAFKYLVDGEPQKAKTLQATSAEKTGTQDDQSSNDPAAAPAHEMLEGSLAHVVEAASQRFLTLADQPNDARYTAHTDYFVALARTSKHASVPM